MVPGDHLHPDARRPAFGHRLDRLRPRRVDQADKAKKPQPSLQRAIPQTVARPFGKGQHPQTLPRHGLRPLVPQVGIDPCAHSQNALGRAFHMHQPLGAVFGQDRHEPMPTVERNCIQPPRGVLPANLPGKGQQRPLHRVALDRPLTILPAKLCVVAQGSRPGQPGKVPGRMHPANRGIALAPHLERPVRRLDFDHHHLVARQCPGLVGADDRNRPDRLDRGHPPDDRMSPGHGLHANRQRDRHHRRQAFRNCRHCHANHGHEQLGKGVAEDEMPVGQQKPRGPQNCQRKQTRQASYLRDERGRQILHPRQQAADPPDLGCTAGRHHQPLRRALRDQRPRPKHRVPVAERRAFGHGPCRLLDWHGLARQDRFLGCQPARVDQPQIGRDLVPGFDQHHVPRHQVDGIDRDPPPVAQDRRPWGKHLPDRRHRRLGLALLDKADHRIDDDDRQDHARIHPVLQGSRHCRGRDQHVDQQIVELAQ
jgi:hypothetical protein